MRWPIPREGFDPRKQSCVEGALGAAEIAAGALIGLVAGLGMFMTGSMILEGRAHQSGRLSPLQGLLLSVGLMPIGLAFLLAGFSLVFGWRVTWRMQAVPVAAAFLAVCYLTLACPR